MKRKTAVEQEIWDDRDNQLMVIAAFRYCLGRQSYIVSTCQGWLKRTWPRLDSTTRGIIVRDTVTALLREEAGGECDTAGWKAFAEWAWETLPQETKVWCHQAVVYTDKPWPLSRLFT